MTSQVNFYERQLEHWQAIMRQASEDGNYDVWASAEREVSNYLQMLQQSGGDVTRWIQET